MDPLDDQPALPRLTPAPFGPRIAAGIFDGLAALLLGVALFEVPFRMGAYALPVWALLAAVLGYSVIPLAAFGATLGMRIFGVELVGRDGKPPDLIELLFREIIARGLGPAAFLGAVSVGAIAAIMGRAQVAGMGIGLGAGFYLSALLLTAAIGGHFIAFGREDRRTLADLVGKTMVIPRALAAVHADADADERAQARAARNRRLVTVVVFEVLIAVGIVVLPVLLSLRAPSNRDYAAHLQLEADAKRFEADPANAALAQRVARGYWAENQPEKAQAVLARQQAAQKLVADAREASLRKRLAEAPHDEDASDALVEMLEDEDRIADARAVREAAYRANPGADAQASYGVWLYQHDFNDDAVAALRGALDGGANEGEVHGYLGLALLELGKKAEARHELHVALQLDPELEGVPEKLADLEGEIGPEPESKPKKPHR